MKAKSERELKGTAWMVWLGVRSLEARFNIYDMPELDDLQDALKDHGIPNAVRPIEQSIAAMLNTLDLIKQSLLSPVV